MAIIRSRARRSSRNPLLSDRAKPQLRSCRRLRSSTTSHRPHRNNFDSTVPLWLDRLPSEVCERIAAAVSSGKRTADALHLAQTSPTQERAVVGALSYSFSLHRSPSDSEAVAAWLLLFHRAGVRRLTVTTEFAKLSSRLRSGTLQLLSKPTLRSAKLPDDPRILRAITRDGNLQELTIRLIEDGPWPMDATCLLMRTLTAQNLRRLDIHCDAPWESECPLRRIEYLSGTRHGLARCCPRLEAFHAQVCGHPGDPYWAIWSTLSSIQEVDVNITRSPPDCVIPRLRETPSVRIHNGIDSLRLARRLGPAVTDVRNLKFSPTATEIEGLSECTRLSVLHILLEEGSETSVLKLAPSIPALDMLALYWERPSKPRRVIEFRYLLDRPGRRLLYLPQYVDITRGVIPRIVKQTPALTYLAIYEVRVRAGEVVDVLKHLGGRLRHFGVSFQDQHESSIERFKTFVTAIVVHNQGLCSVSAGAERLTSFMHIDLLEEEDLDESQIEQLRYGKNLLRTLQSQVKKCVPSLPMERLDRWIEAVLWIEGREL